MMKVAIYGRFEKNFPKEYVSIVLEQLKVRNISVYIESSTLKYIDEISSVKYKSFKSYKDLDESFAFLLVLGGTGRF